jgi:hypothetical protein
LASVGDRGGVDAQESAGGAAQVAFQVRRGGDDAGEFVAFGAWQSVGVVDQVGERGDVPGAAVGVALGFGGVVADDEPVVGEVGVQADFLDLQVVAHGAALARILLRQRDHAATRRTVSATAYAHRPRFPGLHGRPANPEALQTTLKRHGIRPRAGRNTALAGLAAQLPPTVLADLLGVGITTATRWASHARRDWAPFVTARRADDDHR